MGLTCKCRTRAAGQGLAPGGVICMKDNCYSGELNEDGNFEHFFVDLDDSSVTRSLPYFEALFHFAGFRVLHRSRQAAFPDELFPVWMLALEPLEPPAPSAHDRTEAG